MAPHLKKGAPMATSASEVHLWLAPFLDISLSPILFFTKGQEIQSFKCPLFFSFLLDFHSEN